MENSIQVSSEVGTLKRLLIHSPDSGLGKVVPSKAQDWLFEDIIHLDTMRRKEYDFYVKTLLYFLDSEKIKGRLAEIDADKERNFFKPDNPNYFNSDKVIELQKLLAEILENDLTKMKLVAAACAIEKEWYTTHDELFNLPSVELAKTLISGTTPSGEMLFPPIPNFIFTRDIGITINNHILLNRPKKQARTREALLVQYIFYNHSIFEDIRQNLIEIPDNETLFLLPEEQVEDAQSTLEGGDVMMVAKNHLLIGISERTTIYAAKQVIKILFEKKIVEKVTLVKIPNKRDYMHIDTVFTQVKRNMWVLLGSLAKPQIRDEDAALVKAGLLKSQKAEEVHIVQFRRGQEHEPREIESLEELLTEISIYDLDCQPHDVTFIYSGNNEFPYGAREQWTDSCNLLAVKEGVVIGYDRNDKTLEAFKNAGFETVKMEDLLQDFESGRKNSETITNTFIMLPSAELSRARGGSHCMSMPILRSEF
ncbi:arginine deiminase family protein [Arcicella sp. LKC2W]|uniref:arginine deiminase family protein n=1 Tax=Arcicella sp. LKC2W TaxID=2984198 RepID=UPI002B21CCC0|nr:arginine deiminase family protein [Arcicella sp. LKC2W]MEA5458148.1 arginine deiminase family protein [Arcicella sp. LKC2W]